MAHVLRFTPEPPAFVLEISGRMWEKKIEPLIRERKPEEWILTSTEIGFSGCGALTAEKGLIRLTFPLSCERVSDVVASVAALLPFFQMTSNPEDSFFVLWSPVDGSVSGEFRRKLKFLGETDRQAVLENMRRAFAASVAKNLRPYQRECFLSIDLEEERFLLHCFGNACDIAIYPDEAAPLGERCSFSWHNVDAPYQAATLCAGFLTLAERLQSGS
jgi:hypothetical protein